MMASMMKSVVESLERMLDKWVFITPIYTVHYTRQDKFGSIQDISNN